MMRPLSPTCKIGTLKFLFAFWVRFMQRRESPSWKIKGKNQWWKIHGISNWNDVMSDSESQRKPLIISCLIFLFFPFLTFSIFLLICFFFSLHPSSSLFFLFFVFFFLTLFLWLCFFVFLFLCFIVSLFLCFFVSLFLCFFVSLSLCFFVSVK